MTTPKSSWVQLYQARQVKTDIIEARSPGRPPSPIPRHKVGLTLSAGEISEIETWQQRLSELTGRKISIGETVGILARICTARFARLENAGTETSLADLVEKMVGEES